MFRIDLPLVVCLLFSSQPIDAVTTVAGRLPGNQVWTKAQGPYHVIESVELPVGAALRIEPGVEDRLESASIVVRGKLIARGTATEPIVFTSSCSEPRPGDWGFVQFESSSVPHQTLDGEYVAGSILEHVIVEFGGGIYLHNASPLITDSKIWHNCKKMGGGILAVGGKPVVTRCTIAFNWCERSGGGIRTAACTPTITENTIIHNSAKETGGGVAIDFSAAKIRGNKIAYNWASRGGAISAGKPRIGDTFMATQAHSTPDIKGNTITHNCAGNYGGGIDVRGTPAIIDNRIMNNQIRYAGQRTGDHQKARFRSTSRRTYSGAGIAIQGTYGGPAVVRGNTIVGNRGAKWGGGLFMDRCSSHITSNLIVANSAVEFGGGISLVRRQLSRSFVKNDFGRSFDIRGNVFRDNENGAIEMTGAGNQSIAVVECTFESADGIVLINHSEGLVAAERVWLGTLDQVRLHRRVFDFHDDQRFGTVELRVARTPVSHDKALPQLDDSCMLACLRPQSLRVGQGFLQLPGEPPSVTLAWDAVPWKGVAGYRVFAWRLSHLSKQRLPFRIQDDAYGAIDVGGTTGARIGELAPGQEYEFAVVAYDEAGNESGFSEIKAIRVRTNQ